MDIKENETYEAKVKWFNRKSGIGFANVEGISEDIITHFATIEMEGFRYLNEEQSILIEGIEQTQKGLRAIKIIIKE